MKRENSYIDVLLRGGFQPPELPFGIITNNLKKKLPKTCGVEL